MKLAKIYWAILLCAVPLLLTALLKYTENIDTLENNLIDLRYRYANPEHPFTDKLVIVDIDEVTLDTYKSTPIFGRWPWKRNVYQPILEYIAGGMPKLILFDIMFFEESPEDETLIEATESLGIVSHAVNLNKEDLSAEEDKIYEESVPENILNKSLHPENVDIMNLKNYNILQFPIPGISAIAPYVHAVTYTPDSDGVGRRGFLFFKYRTAHGTCLQNKTTSRMSASVMIEPVGLPGLMTTTARAFNLGFAFFAAASDARRAEAVVAKPLASSSRYGTSEPPWSVIVALYRGY